MNRVLATKGQYYIRKWHHLPKSRIQTIFSYLVTHKPDTNLSVEVSVTGHHIGICFFSSQGTHLVPYLTNLPLIW